MHDKVSYRKKQFCASRISSIISCLFFSQLIISDLQSLVLEADIQIGTLLLLGCLLNRDVLTRLTPLPLSTGTHNCSNVTYKIALTLHGFVACRLLQLHGATVVAVAPFVRFPTTYLHSSLSLSLSLFSCRLRTPHVASFCFSATFCFSSHALHNSKQQRLRKLYRLNPYKKMIISYFSSASSAASSPDILPDLLS